MKNTLPLLLRKVFLSSLAGITGSNLSAATNDIIEHNSSSNEVKIESLSALKMDLSPKLLLKKNNKNELVFMSHRSHRSHSSHRSHYSGSSGGTTTTSSSSRGTNTTQTSTTKSYNNSLSNTNNTILKLGSRTLKRGMSGTDVTELINILLAKGFLKLDGGGTQVTGTYTYDEIVENAVKEFQTSKGIPSDGECGSSTIYYLKNN